MRVFSFLLFLILFSSSCSVQISTPKTLEQQVKPLTIFLVRHAEKMTDQQDPDLTKAGYARSADLAKMLEWGEIDAVFSTNFKRTQATAALTVKGRGLELLAYDHKDLEGFSAMLKADYQGKTIVVVGHSNTTPKLAGLLEGTAVYGPFDESDYGNFVIVTVPKDRLGKTVFLRY